MLSEKNSLSKWLVKSENKILGPYTYEQIEDLIRKKQISLIDEVRDSSTRWLYLRENSEFKDIVESIRKELDSLAESTKTYQSFSKTEDIAKTKSDIVAHFTDVEMEVRDITVVKEIIQNQQQDKIQFFQEELNKKEKVKLYGLENDAQIKKNIKKSSNRFLISIFGVFLVLILSTLGFFFVQKFNQQKQEDLWSQQIKKYKFLGLDQKALEIFGHLPPENQKKMIPQVIELLPMLESSGVIQMSEIENLKNNLTLNIEQKVNLQLVHFWLAMQVQNFDLGQEFIVKASTLQPSSPLVKENDAIIQIKKGLYQKAMDIYFDLFKTESSGRYLMGLVISWIGLPPADRIKYTNQISQLIEKYSFVYYDYKKELLLAQLLFAKTEKNENLFQMTWKQFINTPCQLSALFKKPLLLAPDVYSWKDLTEVVNLVKPYLNNEESIIFETHHLIESFKISAANQHITQYNSKFKDNLTKQQMNMLIFHFQSRSSNVIALEEAKQLDPLAEINQVILALNKIEHNPNSDIAVHLKYFDENHLSFYSDWITLTQLMRQKAPEPIKAFIRNHFLTVNNFLPALEAKSLVE
jgi:hypothetical protein